MKPRRLPDARYIILIVFCLVFQMLPETVSAWDYQAGLLMDEILSTYNNYLDADTGRFQQQKIDNQMNLSHSLMVSAGDHLSARILADLYWIHTWDASDPDELDGEISNAYLSIEKDAISSDWGIQSFQPGRGHILYADAPGVTIRLQPAQDITQTLAAARIMDTSPIVSATLDYRTGYLENLSVFGAWYQDRDNALAAMLTYQDAALNRRLLFSRNPILKRLNQNNALTFSQSEADLYWFGLSGDFFIGDLFVSGILILETGSGSVTISPIDRTWAFDLFAYRADLEISYTAADRWTATAFCFLSSGWDRYSNDINVFISPMPYFDRTLIFFSSSFSDQIETDFLSKGGVFWAGVIAPGLKINYAVTENLATTATLAAFFLEKSTAGNRSWYGWEADLGVAYSIYKRYTLSCEFGWFEHGDMYRTTAGTPHPATTMTVGLHTFF